MLLPHENQSQSSLCHGKRKKNETPYWITKVSYSIAFKLHFEIVLNKYRILFQYSIRPYIQIIINHVVQSRAFTISSTNIILHNNRKLCQSSSLYCVCVCFMYMEAGTVCADTLSALQYAYHQSNEFIVFLANSKFPIILIIFSSFTAIETIRYDVSISAFSSLSLLLC